MLIKIQHQLHLSANLLEHLFLAYAKNAGLLMK